MLHRHHIVPKHVGGSDDPSNIIQLTVEDHAIAHKVLYGLWKREQDLIAWLGLSGQITAQKATIAAIKLGGRKRKGVSKSEQHKTKISVGLKNSSNTNRGKKLSPERVRILSESLVGLPKTSIHADRISQGKTGFKAINNKLVTKMIRSSDPIPEGWYLGRHKVFKRPNRKAT